MFRKNTNVYLTPAPAMLLAGILAVFTPAIFAQTAPANKPATDTGSATRYRPSPVSEHALAYYAANWGVDAFTVKSAESGELIRFSYRILNPQKAQTINDKDQPAYLIAPDLGLRLSIPTLEKVGQLRQTSTPESGKIYWMAFSNPGRRVKPGDRVNVVIGQFRAEGLIVE